jgi:hypothetical protein
VGRAADQAAALLLLLLLLGLRQGAGCMPFAGRGCAGVTRAVSWAGRAEGVLLLLLQGAAVAAALLGGADGFLDGSKPGVARMSTKAGLCCRESRTWVVYHCAAISKLYISSQTVQRHLKLSVRALSAMICKLQHR